MLTARPHTARPFPARAHRPGGRECVRETPSLWDDPCSSPPRAAAASSGKLIWMSAPVNSLPANHSLFAEFALPVIHVLLELRIDQRGQRRVGDLAHQRPQQGRRALRHQREQQLQQQRRHRRAFGIVQPIGVAQPLRRVRRRDQAAIAIGADDVFADRAGLGDGVAIVGDDGRFAERMNGAQLLRRPHVRLALIADDLVGHAELFEQPQHALRAGIVEMMNRQHGVPFNWPPLVPAGRTAKSRRPEEQLDIYPGDIDIQIYPGKYKLPKIQSYSNG